MQTKEMIFGTRAAIEAIRSGSEIERIYIQSGLSNDLIKELTTLARSHRVPYTFIPRQKINRLSTKNHQGVIGLLSAVRYASLQNVIDKAYGEGHDPFLILLDRVTDVRNFGAIARSAECAGVDAIVVGEKGNAPVTGDAMKTSAGALNYLSICRESDLKKTLRLLKENGIQIIACTEKAAETIYQMDFTRPTALLFGSEEDGISDVLLKEADALAKIPLAGNINSLNVSVAAGIAIFEVLRQKSHK